MRVALAILAVFALAAGGAQAAAAAVSVGVTGGDGLRIAVSGSIATEISVRPSSNNTKLDVTEFSAQMVPGNGCVQVNSANPQRLRCNKPSLNFVTFVGGSLRDRLFVLDGSGDCQCSGGGGNDEMHGANGADLIDGGTGSDVITGSTGSDVIRGNTGNDDITGGLGGDQESGGSGDDVFHQGAAPDGADDLRGDDGEDEADYGSRKTAVSVVSNASADDGAPTSAISGFAERDFVRQSVEVLRAGVGNDVLRGSSSTPGKLRLFGGPGDDLLSDGPGNDALNGGAGVDRLFASLGSDVIGARDAIDDQVNSSISCGLDFDRLNADVRDDDTRGLPTDCDTIDQGMVGELPNVRIRSARRAGRRLLKVRLSCPRRTRNGCRGRLSAGFVRKRARFGPSKRYRIRRGRSKTVRVRVRRRSLARRGRRVRIRSVERGRLGRRTTFKTLRVR
jgi:Ca2+-binding RTX toxin-like protein